MDGNFHHSFDREGFLFSLKALALFAVIGLTGYSVWFFVVHGEGPSPRPAQAALSDVQRIARPAQGAPFSTTTPVRTIEHLTIAEAIPAEGKFIAADLSAMTLTLYKDGQTVAHFPILTIGRPGSPYETPSGFYEVLTKAGDVYNAGEAVHMPYALQFYGNYFIHGWPYFASGAPVASSYSGGCIRLSTPDAQKVYQFADIHTPLFVYKDPPATTTPAALTRLRAPAVSAQAYLIADLDNGAVYLEKDAGTPRPIASLTKLMTALVANETIMFDKKLSVTRADLLHSTSTDITGSESFTVDELLYPLLMESNNAIADDLSHYYGTPSFVAWMNSTAKALGMSASTYVDPSGVSKENVSTADDLFRLARYEADRKSFIFSVSRTPQKTLGGGGGRSYPLANFNIFMEDPSFIGGKVGETEAAGETMVSLFTLPDGDLSRRIAVIILKSEDDRADTQALLAWIKSSLAPTAACAACAQITPKRTIDY